VGQGAPCPSWLVLRGVTGSRHDRLAAEHNVKRTQHMIYILLVFISFGITLVLTVNAWRRREVAGARPFARVMLASAFWMLCIGMMVSCESAEAGLFWYRLSFLSVAALPLLLLNFVLAFHGRSAWLTLPRLLVIAILPAVSLVIIWTDRWFPLFFQEIMVAQKGELMVITSYTPGFWFPIFSAYQYLLSLVSIGWLLLRAVRQFTLYRKQSIAIITGSLAVLLPNILFSFNLLPPDVSVLPFGFLAMGLLISWSMFSNKFLDMVPVAYSTLIESMSDSMLVIDPQGRIADLNPAMLRMLRALHPQLEGRAPGDLIGQPAATWLAPWEDLAQSSSTAELQSEVELHIAVRPRYLDLRVSPVHNDNQAAKGRLIVMRDITQRVAAEKALRQASEVSARVNRELAQTNTALAANNAEFKAFAHTVAHDLKNPLGNIIAYGDFIVRNMDQIADEELRSYLQIIDSESKRSVKIINALLLLAEIREMADLELEPLDMRLIVQETLAHLGATIANTGAQIITPDEWPTAVGYPPWIEAVFSNYISNALKYGGDPPVIRIDAVVVNEQFVRFFVQDNGPGLSPAEQARLFTPFTRLHHAHAEGHGLGLTIAQRIVEKLGGTIGVESEPGQGATFYFTLPRLDKTTQPDAAA